MIDWLKVVILILRIGEKIFDFAKAQGYIQQGRDEELARQAAAILAKTEYARGVREKLAAMDEKSIDDTLDRIESEQLRSKDH